MCREQKNKEEIKRIRATLAALDLKLDCTAYNKNEAAIIRKKEMLYKQLEAYEVCEKKVEK